MLTLARARNCLSFKHMSYRTTDPSPYKPPARGRRRRSGGGGAASSFHHTSLPTTRGAYAETRQWLLDRHGPICAYCETVVDPESVTLDHVTPRKGKSAYDRRDNLVLACTSCNAEKADRPILAFLLARRSRAANLLHYGSHLSPMLLELVRDIAGPEAAERAERLADPDYPYRD